MTRRDLLTRFIQGLCALPFLAGFRAKDEGAKFEKGDLVSVGSDGHVRKVEFTHAMSIQLPGRSDWNDLARYLGEPISVHSSFFSDSTEVFENTGYNWLWTLPDHIHVMPLRFERDPLDHDEGETARTYFDFVSNRRFKIAEFESLLVERGATLPIVNPLPDKYSVIQKYAADLRTKLTSRDYEARQRHIERVFNRE